MSDVADGMMFEVVRGPRKGERFTVGQSPEYAVPFVKRWLSIGTVRPVNKRKTLVVNGEPIADITGARAHWRGPMMVSAEEWQTADLESMLNYAGERRRAWVETRLREISPDLADVPDRQARFLANVQAMLAASSAMEASRFAEEVAREAMTLAVLRVEWARVSARLMATAPM